MGIIYHVVRVIAGALLVASCSDATPAVIDGPADTLVVNSTVWTGTGIRVLDRKGAPLEQAQVTYAVAPDSILRVSTSGAVSCTEDGTATITVQTGALERRFPIRCEVVRSFGGPQMLTLVAGGPPVPFALEPYDAQGRLMARVRLAINVSDTTVVALRHGMIYPLRPGVARVHATSNARWGGPMIWVKAPPRDDSLRPTKPADSGAAFRR